MVMVVKMCTSDKTALNNIHTYMWAHAGIHLKSNKAEKVFKSNSTEQTVVSIFTIIIYNVRLGESGRRIHDVVYTILQIYESINYFLSL